MDQPSQALALTWLTVGVATRLAYFVTTTNTGLAKPLSLLLIYILTVICLDLFGGGSRKVALQLIAPGVVLAMLVTPGIPPSVALIADLVASLALASTSRITWRVICEGGKALIPATVTAFFLASRSELGMDTYFFATELFLVSSLLLRTTEPPFRSDLFLVVSYPAIALMLRSLAELHVAYLLLAVPLLFLLTTVDTDMLLRYFQLQKKLDDTQTKVKETRRAQRISEIESRRKGVLLNRREQQLTMLNGLGREMDAAEATEDLGRFLLKESSRLTDASGAMILFSETQTGRITQVICPAPASAWGLAVGQAVPPTVRPGIVAKEPWPAPFWQRKKCFLTSRLGNEGWLFLASDESGHFPEFLMDFFTAVGRHAGSAVLSMRRLTEVRATASREALEKEKVATEKEKVAEQNRTLRLLIENFEGLTEGALTSDQELLQQGSLSVMKLTGAERVLFQSPDLSEIPRDESGVLLEGQRFLSSIFLPGNGPSGSMLCLARRPNAFSESHLEWCSLLKDFLDKTMENSNLHREVQASYAQLERTQEESVLSSQWAAAGRLAANAAHELNTPLGAIRLAAEQASFFLKPESTPEPAIQGIQSILRSVDRCRQVTDRLLLTSRPVDQGEVNHLPETQPLIPILKEAVASVRPYLRASNILLADHRLLGDYQVHAVFSELYWAVVNILKNGIDALNESGPEKKQMAVAVMLKKDSVQVKIADNGPGMEPEVAARAFEPFFTTKKLGQGNGLGLSMSRTNLRRWGGDIEFEETPGGGATFVLTVPLAKG